MAAGTMSPLRQPLRRPWRKRRLLPPLPRRYRCLRRGRQPLRAARFTTTASIAVTDEASAIKPDTERVYAWRRQARYERRRSFAVGKRGPPDQAVENKAACCQTCRCPEFGTAARKVRRVDAAGS